MMFINHSPLNDADTLATNLFRPANLATYDTAIQLQSSSNSMTFGCHQKPSLNLSYPISSTQTTVSYASSTPYTPLYSNSSIQQAPNSNHTLTNLIPMNIAIFNPALYDYNTAIQNATTSTLIPTQSYTQIPGIQNFGNYSSLSQKYILETKLENPINSNYRFGEIASQATKSASDNNKTNNSGTRLGSIVAQSIFLNQKHILKQQDSVVSTSYLPSTIQNRDVNNVFLRNVSTTNAPTIYSTLNSLSDIPVHSNLAVSNVQAYNSNANCLKKRKRRYKKPIEMRKVLPKNSLMLLHELRPNVEYRFVNQNGPIHRPIFTMSVDINEHTFEGVGKTKKEARIMAAEKALKFLMEFPRYIQRKDKINGSKSESTECKSDDSNIGDCSIEKMPKRKNDA